jgi:hypothetical protein
MNLRFVIISVLLIPLHGISQTTSFAYQRKSIGEIDSAETFLRSKKQTFNFKISVSPDYLPGLNTSNLANPISYQRITQDLSLKVQYFYSAPDSITRFVEYSWDGNKNNRKKLLKLFEENKITISGHLATSKGTIIKAWDSGQNMWNGRTITWENNDVFIKQFLIFGGINYRVRVLILWK